MQALELQTGFFKLIKERLPAHMSLVHEIAQLLNISSDSAYRRIRGEKTLRFDEIQLLVSHFKISLDQFFQLPSDTYFFFGDLLEKNKLDIRKTFKSLNEYLSIVLHSYKKEITGCFNDIPFLYSCNFLPLAAFQCYLLEKKLMNGSEAAETKFRVSGYGTLLGQELDKMADAYSLIPSREIWNAGFMDHTLNQMEYCIAKGLFASDSDLNAVRDSMASLIDLLETQSLKKFKTISPKKISEKDEAECLMYINYDLPLSDMVMVESDDLRIVGLQHNIINYAFTSDDYFVKYTRNSIERVINASIRLDTLSPTAHQHFFNTLRKTLYDKNARNGYAYY